MPHKHYPSHRFLEQRAEILAEDICGTVTDHHEITLYGVPRGGVPAAYLVQGAIRARGRKCVVHQDCHRADAIIDDLIDSGATRDKFMETEPRIPFHALYEKEKNGESNWIVFPWEKADDDLGGASDIPLRLLQFIGEDPTRGGLQETPDRFLKAWEFWTKGYAEEPNEILKTFEDGAKDYDQMVLVRDIPVYSHCEHHMAPIFGVAHLAYIPDGNICGLSKLNRLVDIFARRLQVQERLTAQIAEALESGLEPLGVGVQLKCRHLCMESRGVCQQGHVTITSALRGAMKDEPEARAEFMKLCE